MKLIIATDFSTAPGPRYISEGKFSGELFRKDYLLPKLREAIESNAQLTVNLDGTSGYGTPFLEESFGGLIRIDNLTLAQLEQSLIVISGEAPEYWDEIKEHMDNAEKERQKKA